MPIQGAHAVIQFKQQECINVSDKVGTVGQDLQYCRPTVQIRNNASSFEERLYQNASKSFLLAFPYIIP